MRQLLGPMIAAACLVGCETQPAFESCQMNDRMLQDCEASLLNEQCSASQTSCYATCTVLDHPSCPDGPCMIYQYRPVNSEQVYRSGPFCTSTCDPAGADCPSNGTCQRVLGQYFCVPNKTETLK